MTTDKTDQADDIEFITGKEARRILGVLTPSTMYRQIHAGKFPKPVNRGRRSTRFVRSECIAFARKAVEDRDREKAG